MGAQSVEHDCGCRRGQRRGGRETCAAAAPDQPHYGVESFEYMLEFISQSTRDLSVCRNQPIPGRTASRVHELKLEACAVGRGAKDGARFSLLAHHANIYDDVERYHARQVAKGALGYFRFFDTAQVLRLCCSVTFPAGTCRTVWHIRVIVDHFFKASERVSATNLTYILK